MIARNIGRQIKIVKKNAMGKEVENNIMTIFENIQNVDVRHPFGSSC